MIWPLSVGLWNLRCNVNGTLKEVPKFSEHDLAARFSAGSGIHGVNYKRAFVETDWEMQQRELALMLLNSTIPIYEGWIDTLLHQEFNSYLPPKSNLAEFEKKLQFPDSVADVIATLTSDESEFMRDNYFPKFKEKKKRSVDKLKQILYCYRVYKEIRNCCMHKGNIADEKLVKSYNEYITNVYNPDDIGVKVLPEFAPPVRDEPVDLSLQCAVALGEIVIKLIASIDAELTRSKCAEDLFVRRMTTSKAYGKKLKSNYVDAIKQVRNYTTAIRMPVAIDLDRVRLFLLSKGIIGS